MRSALRQILLLTALIFSAGETFCYTEKPALVHLDIRNQNDTFGFNLVAQLPGLLYDQILSGDLPVYESPAKSTQISPGAFQSIEKTNRASFLASNHLFLYELWSSRRRHTEFIILGMAFVYDAPGNKVSFGYIDIKDAFPLLIGNKIDCNANGPAELTYWQALHSLRYNFSLVQFGKKNFEKDPAESIKIKKKAFNPKKTVDGKFLIPNTKEISYTIDQEKNNPDDMGTVVFTQIEELLNRQRDIFFNIGGSRYYDYKTYQSGLKVTGIEVNEVWKKENGHLIYEIRSVTLFVNNKQMSPVTLEFLESFGLMFRFKTLEDVLKEKQFRYIMTRMNSVYIPEVESATYLKALQNYSWTQISRYVKFY